MLQFFRKKQQFLAVSYATILHCLVDFCCIYLMMQLVLPACQRTRLSDWLIYTILYNFIAFAGQLPVGILGDWLQRNMNLIAVGLLLLLIAYCGALFGFPIPYIVLLLGIGNACFHVGGGRAAMEWKENACQPVGIFVATGAFGVFGGKWVFGNGMNWIIPMIVVLSVALLIQLIFCYHSEERNLPKQAFSIKPVHGSWSLLMAFCCILVVVLRSFTGNIMQFPWSKGWFALFLTLAIVLGKAGGGILADRFGIRSTIIGSLTICALLFLGANRFAICGLLAVFLFNMTMPITLSLLGMQFPHAKGMAFGALTFALFVGLIPSYFRNTADFTKPWVYCLLTVLSLVILYAPMLRNAKKRNIR